MATRQARKKLIEHAKTHNKPLKWSLNRLRIGNKMYTYDVTSGSVVEQNRQLNTRTPQSHRIAPPFSLSFTNIRSVMSKLDHLASYLDDCDCDIFALTETWLHPDIATMKSLPQRTAITYTAVTALIKGAAVSFWQLKKQSLHTGLTQILIQRLCGPYVSATQRRS